MQEENYQELEANLLAMEGELRYLTKRDQLSSKVINLRKDVDKGREDLRKLQVHRDQLKSDQDILCSRLRNIEYAEKRRNEVCLDTEKTLSEAK